MATEVIHQFKTAKFGQILHNAAGGCTTAEGVLSFEILYFLKM